MRRRRSPLRSLVAAWAVAGMVLLTGACGGDDTSDSSAGTRASATTPVTTATRAPPVATGVTGLPTITVDELPTEALDTLALIDEGGPFPHDQDGSTFQNREGILPDQPRGYYREYTVETPGSDDRGARRIVTGDRGESFYTDDHYDSFQEIVGR